MDLILLIETSTQVCSVALSDGPDLIAIRESDEPNIHASHVALFIDEVSRESGVKLNKLSAVAVSKGPGSYTGLRIGVSSAKGLCYSADIPLISVSTLRSMTSGLVERLKAEGKKIPADSLFCPMIDARRMEVYNGLYDTGLELVRAIRAEVIQASSFSEELERNPVWFFGDGAEKCRPLLGNNPHANFIQDFTPSARFMIPLAYKKYQGSRFEDTAYFEPFYLKDFIPGLPRIKGLR